MKQEKLSDFIDDVLSELEFLNLPSEICFMDFTDSINEILFDSDKQGNGKRPYICIKFYSNHIKFSNGFQLSKEEKAFKLFFKDDDTAEFVADQLIVYLNRYFKSFHLTRKASLLD